MLKFHGKYYAVIIIMVKMSIASDRRMNYFTQEDGNEEKRTKYEG